MTYRLLIEYDGSAFCGWQRQHGPPSVQAALEEALAIVLQVPTPITGAGRTDSGVHARGQVAHFQACALDTGHVQRSLNGLTPPSVVVHALEVAPDGFNARFDATSRRYHYYVNCENTALERHFRYMLPYSVCFGAMNEAATHLLGEHHFGAFCLHRSATRNRVCNVTRAQWMPESRPHEWRFEVEANRFLHGMVRAIVGTLLDVGRGKRPMKDVARTLDSRDRRKAGPAAPPYGLVLEFVRYAE